MQNQLIRLSICISDIPKSKIKKSKTSGKLYADVVVVGRKEADQYGNDITVYASQTQEEQQAKMPKNYCGQGKLYSFESNYTAPNDADLANLAAGAVEVEPKSPGEMPATNAGEDLPF